MAKGDMPNESAAEKPPSRLTRAYVAELKAEAERMRRGEVPIKFVIFRPGKGPGDPPRIEQIEMRSTDPRYPALRGGKVL